MNVSIFKIEVLLDFYAHTSHASLCSLITNVNAPQIILYVGNLCFQNWYTKINSMSCQNADKEHLLIAMLLKDIVIRQLTSCHYNIIMD